MSNSSSEDDLPAISFSVGRPVESEGRVVPKPIDASTSDRTRRKRQEALVKTDVHNGLGPS